MASSRRRKTAFERALDEFESAIRSNQMHNHGVIYPPRYPNGAPPDKWYERSRDRVMKAYFRMKKKWAEQVHANRQMEEDNP